MTQGLQLIKGRTVKGKWYVRPVGWAGVWNCKGELISGATLREFDNETECNKYMNDPQKVMEEIAGQNENDKLMISEVVECSTVKETSCTLEIM